MEETQRHVQDLAQDALGDLGGLAARLEGGLGQLDVPVEDLVPGEVEQGVGELRELVVLVVRVDLGDHRVEPGEDPAVRGRHLRRVRQRALDRRAVHQGETGGVPDLVGEVPGALDPVLADRDVDARVGAAREGEAEGVGAVLVHPVQRVDHVPEGLGHLLAVLVTDHAVQGDGVERRGAVHRVEAEHHHPGDPEEEDVVAGDQDGVRVELRERLGLLGPAERGEGPQTGGEPGVQDVGVLVPALAARRLLVGADADDLARGAVPDGDAVAPPELARDAPVVEVVDPVEVPLLHLLRVDRDPAVADRVTGGLRERADLDPPLHGQARLDGGLAARAVADGVDVGPLLGDDPALGAQRGDDGGAGLEAVQALEGAVGGDDGVLVHHGDGGQVVPLADLEVVRVVGGRHLDGAGAELGVDVLVGDDGDGALGQRQLDELADQVLVALVLGVDGDGGVAEHRLRAGGGDDDGLVVALPVLHGDQFAVVVLVLDLDVGDGRQAARAPVDDALGAVDQLVVVEALEDGLDGLGQALVHGEPLARPRDAVAEAAHLAADLAAGLGLPLPDPLDEGLPAQVVPGLALLAQFALDDVLRGDAGVVHAGLPQRLVALHALAAGQGVDERVLEGVPEVQAARDVRRRDDDGVRRLVALRVGFEVTPFYPALVQLPLYLGRRVLGRQFGGGCGLRLLRVLGHGGQFTGVTALSRNPFPL